MNKVINLDSRNEMDNDFESPRDDSGEPKNKKRATNVALMVKHKVLTELNNFNVNNYLNISIYDCNVEEASVALMVKHQSNKLGPNRLPGSKLYLSESPGWGASTFNNSKINWRVRNV